MLTIGDRHIESGDSIFEGEVADTAKSSFLHTNIPDVREKKDSSKLLKVNYFIKSSS